MKVGVNKTAVKKAIRDAKYIIKVLKALLSIMEEGGLMGVFTGYCPNCGVPMVKRKFIDTWDPDGTPDEIHEDWCCSECLLRWVPLETEPEKAEA